MPAAPRPAKVSQEYVPRLLPLFRRLPSLNAKEFPQVIQSCKVPLGDLRSHLRRLLRRLRDLVAVRVIDLRFRRARKLLRRENRQAPTILYLDRCSAHEHARRIELERLSVIGDQNRASRGAEGGVDNVENPLSPAYCRRCQRAWREQEEDVALSLLKFGYTGNPDTEVPAFASGETDPRDAALWRAGERFFNDDVVVRPHHLPFRADMCGDRQDASEDD